MSLVHAQSLHFRAVDEAAPGPAWLALFREFWPAYQRWYLQCGDTARPYYLECARALRAHMPELASTYEALVALVGGGDLEARFLSMYCPPPYVSGCSQAVWPGPYPVLVRNYDYPAQLCEGVILKTAWDGRGVIGMSDCNWGLLDGINEDGLAISLSFGGRRVVGEGFGVPLMLRYVLQTCTHTAQAAATLARIPVHMSYNVTLVDASGDFATVYLAPDRPSEVRRTAAATNHQRRIEWHQHASATASVERERRLLLMLQDSELSAEMLRHAFLQPPIYSTAFTRGFGTLYSAAYWPGARSAEFFWPHERWPQSFAAFAPGERLIRFVEGALPY